MSKLISYLTFNGNCRQAMHFYQKCLGGKLHFRTLNESSQGKEFPAPMKKFVLHALLENDSLLLIGTDLVHEDGLSKGNAVSILLDCSSKEEAINYYSKLAEEGKVTHPIAENYWGSLSGGLTDKHGIHWLFFCRK